MARRSTRQARGARPPKNPLLTSRLRIAGVALVCAKVVLVPLIFDLGSDIPFVVTKGLLSHALAYALVGVIVALFFQYGRASVSLSWLHLPVAAFLVVNAVAAIFAADQIFALYGAHRPLIGAAAIPGGGGLYFPVLFV